MNILDFAIDYPDEETCRRCNCKEHYWLENKQAYECKRYQARQTLGVYYKVKPGYLQYDLNQFRYKFNRRYFGENQFDRLLIAAVSYAPDFKSRIYNGNYCG